MINASFSRNVGQASRLPDFPRTGLASTDVGLGRRVTKAKDFDKSIKDLTECIQLDPKNATSYAVRAMVYLGKEDFDNAIKDYTEAIRLNPRFSEAYGNRASAYVGKKQYDKAIQDYTKAIQLNPKEGIPYYNRGKAYFEKKDYESAARIMPKRFGSIRI